MLTPQEVSERAFPKASFGGYNMTQVDEFLDVLRTRHYETVSPHPSSIDRAAERSGLASDRAIDTIIYGKDVPGVRKQASGKGGAVPVRQSDKSAKSERKAKELLDSKVADKDTKSASDEEE